jgi:hypothetical protein
VSNPKSPRGERKRRENMFAAAVDFGGKEKLYIEAPARAAREALDILGLKYKTALGAEGCGFYIEIPQHFQNNLYEFANVLQRVIEAVREKQENEDDEWFDFSERPIVTKRDVREIIQDLTNEQLLLIKCWVEEEVKKRTPLSK